MPSRLSVTEGITFDYRTPSRFFRAGWQLLLAEEDNINRNNKINGGIYTAKAKKADIFMEDLHSVTIKPATRKPIV